MLYWNEDLGFNEQNQELQQAVYEAMGTEPADEEHEDCGECFTRILWQRYWIENLQIQISYLYANAPDSDEWGALINFIIQKL